MGPRRADRCPWWVQGRKPLPLAGSTICPACAVRENCAKWPAVMTRFILCVAAILLSHAVWADETCRYSGTTSYDGQVSVQTTAATANGGITVDVAANVKARSFGLIDWQYLYQEIGTWRDGELQTIGVNHRYSVIGSIRRQQWDLFRRAPSGMQAWRVQAKTLADFETKHPGFVRHWSPASFGENWLPDYSAAPPERRTDLDLPRESMPPGLGTPLLMAFWSVRWAGNQERNVPVFLPGFKHDSRADILVNALGTEPGGLLHLHTSARHPQLSEVKVSTGDAWISADHHLVRETFEAHTDTASAHGELHLDGCQGVPPTP